MPDLLHTIAFFVYDYILTMCSPTSYDLLRHNCNNFTEEIAQFLCGTSIPKYILDLPNEVLQSSLGPAIHALVLQLEKSARPIEDEHTHSLCRQSKEASPGFDQLNSEIDEARSDTRTNGERGVEKKK